MLTEIKPDYHLPTEIYIRQDIINDIAEIIKKHGTRAIIITTTSDLELFQTTIESIYGFAKQEDLGCIIYDELPKEPTTEDIDQAVAFIKKTNCDLIIGFGGIESINAAKAISILITNYLFCYDLFSSPQLLYEPVNLVTIPAYPIFGFEIAPLLYLTEIHSLSKMIYQNDILYPKATIVDPEISLLIDEDKTMKTAVSTLAVSAESIISKVNNDIINTYALKSIDLIFRNLPVAYRETENSVPRIYLSTASVMAGIAFSIAYLSLTLAISLALTSISNIELESAMSIILPHIMEFNLTSSPGRYVQMSKVMGEDVRDITVIEAAIKAVEAIRKLETDIEIPQRLANYDVSKADFKEISQLATSYPFIGNSPRELDKNEIETILIAAY